MVDKFLEENWIDAKINLGEWNDVNEVVKDSEDYDM